MTKILIKIIAAVGCLGTLFLVGYIVYFFYAMGMFDKDYSVSELKENFTEKKTEIYELKNYFSEIVPNGTRVSIEYDGDNTLNRLSISYFLNDHYEGWNLETNTMKMDSIIEPLGWTRDTLQKLKSKLDAANCIGINSGEPVKIAFKRSGMGVYSFNVFNSPVTDSLKTQYNDSCTYILVNSKLALEYGGGAIGSQCFYNLK